MSDRLVTVGSFWSVVEANIALNVLQEAGIKSTLADEESVGMMWHLSNALGGIKLKVFESDAEQALKLLERLEAEDQVEIPDDWFPATDDVDAAQDESPNEPDQSYTTTEPLNERQKLADRAFRMALFGLIMLPFQFYTLWLVLRVYLADDPLGADRRWKVWLALGMSWVLVVMMVIAFRL